MNRVITEKQAQQIIDYLVSKPYSEVYVLVPLLINLPDEDKPKKKTT